MKNFKNTLTENIDHLYTSDEFNAAYKNLKKIILNVKKKKQKVFIIGNGGSAAISSHVSVDLSKNLNMSAMCFSDADLITCFANDYGYENWYKEALIRHASKGDAVILISSSGKSKNMLNALKQCKKNKFIYFTLTGMSKNSSLKKSTEKNHNIYVNSNNYNVIEAIHLIILLNVIEDIME